MDFSTLKRKELQALCKEHGIRANLTNVEMASKHKIVMEGKQQKRTKSCFMSLKNDVGDVENEKVEGKEGKRVRFSPQNETFLFERTDPRERRLLARKMRTMRKSEIETNPVLVIENVSRVEEAVGEKNSRRNSRKRAVVKPGTVGEDPVSVGCVEKPIGRNLRRKSMAVLVSQDVNNVEIVAEKGNIERNIRKRSMVKSDAVLVSLDIGNVEKPIEGETLERNVRRCGRKTIQKDVETALSSPCVEKKAKRGRKGHRIVEDVGVDDTGHGMMVTRRKLRSREVRAENLGRSEDDVVGDPESTFLKKGGNEKSENVVQVKRRSARQLEKGKAINYASICKEQGDDKEPEGTSESSGKSDNASREAESMTIEVSSAQRLDQFILDKKMEVGLGARIEANVQPLSIVEGCNPVSAAPIATVHKPMEESADTKTVSSLQNSEAESSCSDKEPVVVESQTADTIEALSESPTINKSYLLMQSGSEDVSKPNTPERSKVNNGDNKFISSSMGELGDGLRDIGATHQSKNERLSKLENGPQESVCIIGVKLKNEDPKGSELLRSAADISEKLDDQVIEQEEAAGLGESSEAKDVVLEPEVSIATLHKSLEGVEQTKEEVKPLQNRGVGFTGNNGEELNMVESQTKDGNDNMSQSFSTINTSWLHIESQVEGSLKKGEDSSKETLRGDLSCFDTSADLLQEDIQSRDDDEHAFISSSLKMGEESNNETMKGDLSCIDNSTKMDYSVDNDKSLAVVQLEVESKKAAGITIDNVLAMDAQGDYPVLQDRERDEVACEANTSPCNVDSVRNEEHVIISTVSGKTKDYSANPAQVQDKELSKGSYPGRADLESKSCNSPEKFMEEERNKGSQARDSSPLTTKEETKQIMENLCDNHIVQGSFGTNIEELQFSDNAHLNYETESAKCVDSVEKELESLSHQMEYVEEAQVGTGSGGNEDVYTIGSEFHEAVVEDFAWPTKPVDSVEKEPSSTRTGTGDDMRVKGMSSDGNNSPKNTIRSKFDEAAGDEGITGHNSLLIDVPEEAKSVAIPEEVTNGSREKVMDGCLIAVNNNCYGDHADGAEGCENASEHWSESLQTLFDNEGSDTLHAAYHADLEEVYMGNPYPQGDEQDEADQVRTKDIIHRTMVEPQLFGDNVKESDRTKEDYVAQGESEHAEVNHSVDACMAKTDNLASERPENLQSFLGDIAEVSDVTLIDQGKPDNSEDFTDLLQEHNVSPSMSAYQQKNCTGFISAASASITTLQVQGYNTSPLEKEVDSLPLSPMTNATNLDVDTDILDVHESDSSPKLDVPGVLIMAHEVMISNAFSVPNKETRCKDCKATSEAVLVEGEKDIACKAMDGHPSINMREQRGKLSDASQERHLDSVEHLWEAEHGKVLISEVSGEECDIVVEDFPKPCDLGTESGFEGKDFSDLSNKADVVSSSPRSFEDFTDQLQQHNASPSMSACQQLNCTSFTSATTARIITLHGYRTAVVEKEVHSLPSSPMTNATNLDAATDVHDIHESNSSQKLDVLGVMEMAQEVMISTAFSVPNNETSYKDCEATSDKEDSACKALDDHPSINMPEQRGVLSDASQERHLDSVGHIWEGEHGKVLVSEVSDEECDIVVEDFHKPCELGTESGLEDRDITDLSNKTDVVSSLPCAFEDFTDQLQEHHASPSMSTHHQINSTGFTSASSASITTLHGDESVKASCDVDQVGTKDILGQTMVEPELFGGNVKESDKTEGAVQDDSVVRCLPSLNDSVRTKEDHVAQGENITLIDQGKPDDSEDLTDQLQEHNAPPCTVFTSAASASITALHAYSTDPVETEVESLPSSPMTNATNLDVTDMDDIHKSNTNSSQKLEVPRIEEMEVMISNAFSVPNNETSCKDCEATSEEAVPVEGKEDIACKPMDDHPSINMPEQRGVHLDSVCHLWEGEYSKVLVSEVSGEECDIVVEDFPKPCELVTENGLEVRDITDLRNKAGVISSSSPCGFEDFTDQLQEHNAFSSMSTCEQINSTGFTSAASASFTTLHETEENKDQKYNIESCMFSSWEMDLVWGEMAKKEVGEAGVVGATSETSSSMIEDAATNVGENPMNVSDDDVTCPFNYKPPKINEAGTEEVVISDDNKAVISSSSMIQREKNRSIMIHGTIRKQPLMRSHDMKENAPALKMVDVTAVKPIAKRKALEDLPW